MNKLVCKICNKECKSFKSLAAHTRQKHKISKKNYYDNFFKTKNEGKCKFIGCNNDTRFYNLNRGYSEFCSQKCYNNFPERLELAKKIATERMNNPVNIKLSSENCKKQWIENKEYIKLMTTKNSEFRIKQAKWQEDKYKDPKERRKTSESIKKAYDKKPELRIKAANHSKKMWDDPNSKFNTEEYLIKIMDFFRKGKKSKPEKNIEEILLEVEGSFFKYTGDGSFWINRKNPDFTDVKNKKVIEVFGDYYHSEPFRKKYGDILSNEQHCINRINHFKESGYNCLILWEHETKKFEECKNKIIKFINEEL